MNHKSKKIVFCGGGTLGPVTPLLAVAAELRRAEPDISLAWIGTADGPERALVEAASIPFQAISSGKLRRYLDWRNVTDVFRIILGFFQALYVLGRLRAGAVVSAGGFVAVPIIWAARLRGIPSHVHQQDPIPGLANRLSVPFAASMSVALEESIEDFHLSSGMPPVWTGNPVRAEIMGGSAEEARRIFGLETGVPTVLVLGGGTGAAGLNALVHGALPRLLKEAQVIHVAGRGKASGARAGRYHEFELLTAEMPNALAVADLVVTRAGMGTLSELALLGKACVILPMPRSHQEANAAVFGRAGAAVLLDETNVSSERFADVIIDLLTDGSRRQSIGAAMRSLNRPNAAERVARIVLKMAYLR